MKNEKFTADNCGYIRMPHPEYQLLIDYYNQIMCQYWNNCWTSYRLQSMLSDFLVTDLQDLSKRMVSFLNNPQSRLTIGLLNFIAGITTVEAIDKSIAITSHREYPTLFSYWKLLELLGGKETFLSIEQDPDIRVTPDMVIILNKMQNAVYDTAYRNR